MKSRLTVLPASAVILLVLLGCVFERSEGATRRDQSNAPPADGAKATNAQSQREARVTAGTKNQVAFDTTPGSQRRTIRYVLEVTDASGQVTLHDLKKPKLIQRQTIMVPLPDLAPGDYKLVVIAEGNGDAKRSATLLLHVDPK
jgi:hypothetical protein